MALVKPRNFRFATETIQPLGVPVRMISCVMTATATVHDDAAVAVVDAGKIIYFEYPHPKGVIAQYM